MAEHVNAKKSECPTPAGILVIIGGKENKGEQPGKDGQSQNVIELEILKDFTGYIKKKKPVIEIITSASSEGEESFKEYRKLFKQLDITEVRHIHHNRREEALNDQLIERIDQADAFFFSGGDQLKLTTIYGGTHLLTELKSKYISSPIVIGGTSAGAMALSTPMIYAGNKDEEQICGEIKVTTGLEFLKDACIDTHFVHRGRFVRMAQVIVSNPSCIGFGIEEDTAIVVRNGLEAEIIGSGTVIVMEGSNISDTNFTNFAEVQAVSIRNLTVHLLARGDKYIIPQINPPHK
ncbi:MAG: cyanophycinase [Niastella sp.]|uniref:cyanophycinase n=1 Tax=Niastella sp. TaxID=1869183 RepID=UPI00389AA5B8